MRCELPSGGCYADNEHRTEGDVTMADALAHPIAEIAVLLAEGKLKARELVDAAIANHERFGRGTGRPLPR